MSLTGVHRVDYKSKTIELEGQPPNLIKLQIWVRHRAVWRKSTGKLACSCIRSRVMCACFVRVFAQDTAGQERFRTLTAAYYRGAAGVMLMYDVTNEESFQHIRRWMSDVQKASPEVQCVLVGCKSDLWTKRAVKKSRAKALAEEYGQSTARGRRSIRLVDLFAASSSLLTPALCCLVCMWLQTFRSLRPPPSPTLM